MRHQLLTWRVSLRDFAVNPSPAGSALEYAGRKSVPIKARSRYSRTEELFQIHSPPDSLRTLMYPQFNYQRNAILLNASSSVELSDLTITLPSPSIP
jgi:hypothetical protein